MTKQQQLDDLAKQIVIDNVCPELAETATRLVMGAGSPDADLVLIGEAPGKSEDEQGLPFVGASGKFLNQMLESVQMSRQDIYITNIVKYRPPNNRDPKPAEKEDFWPYLLRQLEIINPTVIATLGSHSLGFFMPGVRISEVHGEAVGKQVIYHDGSAHQWLIVPLYHPAAALYNGSMRATLLSDFQGLARQLLD